MSSKGEGFASCVPQDAQSFFTVSSGTQKYSGVKYVNSSPNLGSGIVKTCPKLGN